MKKLVFALVLSSTLMQFYACEKQSSEVIQHVDVYSFKSIDDVIKLRLDKKFKIAPDVYQAFINNIVFRNNRIRGLKHADIEATFVDDATSNAFWAYFDLRFRGDKELFMAKSGALEGYIEHGERSCKKETNYACFPPDEL